MTSPSTTIDLIRHGEPVGGARYRGHTDDPLSEQGWAQMRGAVNDHNSWDVIVSSPLLRCAEFASEIASRHNIPLQTDERFKEIFFGPWEGKTADELLQQDKDCLQRFWSDPVNNMPAGAETIHDFEQRVLAGWNDIVAQHTQAYPVGRARRHDARDPVPYTGHAAGPYVSPVRQICRHQPHSPG